MEEINHYKELKEKVEKEEKELEEIVDKLNRYYRSKTKEQARIWMGETLGKYFLNSGYETNFYAGESYNGKQYPDTYRFVKFTRLTRDGILEGKYQNVTKVYSSNPEFIELHRTDANIMKSVEEVKRNFQELTDEMVVHKEKKEKEIKKNNIEGHIVLTIFAIIASKGITWIIMAIANNRLSWYLKHNGEESEIYQRILTQTNWLDKGCSIFFIAVTVIFVIWCVRGIFKKKK